MENLIKFNPLIKSSLFQTIIGSQVGIPTYLPSKTDLVTLPDQDKIALEISRPKSWKDGDPIILMLHGAFSSSNALYLKRMGKRFYKLGLQVIRMNFRGSGSGFGLAKRLYDCCCSPDLEFVLRHLNVLFPKSRIVLIGVSMGAHIALKLGGELKGEASKFLQSIVAVSPPVNLFSTTKLIIKPQNRFISNQISKAIHNCIDYLHSKFTDYTLPKFPSKMTIADFDELYVAPRANFHSVQEYYKICSSQYLVPEIRVPTKILFAKDDPIISHTSLDHLMLPSNVQVYKTDFGGHLGYMGMNIFKDFRWMDNLVVGWVSREIKYTS